MDQEIKGILSDLFFGGDLEIPIDRHTDLLGDGICDSLGLVQLAGQLERRFPGLRIQDQDITQDNLGTIELIASFVRRKTGDES
jgi:acyl carrier protein